MSDLISRQAAIELIHSLYPSAPIMRMNRERWEKKYKPYIEAEKALEKLPSSQPERKKGEWIPQDHNKTTGNATTLVYYYPKCSECGHTISDFSMNFCPNCGADMREEN